MPKGASWMLDKENGGKKLYMFVKKKKDKCMNKEMVTMDKSYENSPVQQKK